MRQEDFSSAPPGQIYAGLMGDTLLTVGGTDAQNDLANWNLWDDLYAWFGARPTGSAPAQSSGPHRVEDGVIGLVFPGRYRDDAGVRRADCFVLLLFDSDGAADDSDAQLLLYSRQGSDTETLIADCVDR
jgi:hypothetical protein